ncbi:MAG: hypothetical protein JWQ02_4488 [Capsulimonas sp.]|nr:hypothetical protein [Capsulimonas sp.]
MLGEQKGNRSLVGEREAAGVGEFPGVILHRHAQSGRPLVILHPGITMKSDQRPILRDPDELTTHHAPRAVAGVDHALVPLTGVRDRGEGVGAADAQACPHIVSHLKNLQRIKLHRKTELFAGGIWACKFSGKLRSPHAGVDPLASQCFQELLICGMPIAPLFVSAQLGAQEIPEQFLVEGDICGEDGGVDQVRIKLQSIRQWSKHGFQPPPVSVDDPLLRHLDLRFGVDMRQALGRLRSDFRL